MLRYDGRKLLLPLVVASKRTGLKEEGCTLLLCRPSFSSSVVGVVVLAAFSPTRTGFAALLLRNYELQSSALQHPLAFCGDNLP
jgi:hypothetical protein